MALLAPIREIVYDGHRRGLTGQEVYRLDLAGWLLCRARTAGAPQGADAAGVSLGVLALVLGIFSARSLRARAAEGFYPLLASRYALVGVVASAIWQVARFNRDGTRLSAGILLGGVVLAIVASALARRWKRT